MKNNAKFKEQLDQFQPNTKHLLVKGIQNGKMMVQVLIQWEMLIKEIHHYIEYILKSSSEP